MNGIKLNKKPITDGPALIPKMFPAERERLDRRRVNTKLIVTVLITNILIYTGYTILSDNKECLSSKTLSKTLPHKGYTKVVLPVTILAFIPPGQREYKVSVFDNFNRLVFQTAYLHPRDHDRQSEEELRSEEQTLATIEVPTNMIGAIKPSKSYFIYPFHKKKPLSNRGKSYEFIF